MEQARITQYFLGANSARGFASLYEDFFDPASGGFLWVIKGGPGCGKSTFMRRIGRAAEKAGQAVEYIRCSGDPDSLDGVWLPGKGVGYVDGTAPHVQECAYPGASSLYLDLGAFLDPEALTPLLPEITEVNRRYKALYQEAYGLLTAAAALLPRNCPGLIDSELRDRLAGKVRRMAARELPKLGKASRIRRRFLSALSCRGRVTLADTVSTLCPRVILLDNALGLGNLWLELLLPEVRERGYDGVVCHDPLEPEKTEALLLPEAGLAFVAVEGEASDYPSPYRRLRLDGMPEREALAEKRALLRQRRRDSELLLNRAVDSLAEAKRLHDELELLYRPHVDFSGPSALAEAHMAKLGL